MAEITVLKRETGKAHLTSADEANDQLAISGLVRTAAGTASLYADAFTTAITLGTSGTPTTVADHLTVSGEIRGPSNGTGITVGQVSAGASTGSTIQLTSFTSTERDDLVEADGMVVYNETVPNFQFRVNGAWVDLASGSGVATNDIAHTTGFTTTSTAGALVTGLTFTPAAGTYKVIFSGSGFPQNNNVLQSMTIWSGGAASTGATRDIRSSGGGTTGMRVGFCVEAEVVVNGAQAIEAYLNINIAGTAEIFDSSLSIVEVT